MLEEVVLLHLKRFRKRVTAAETTSFRQAAKRLGTPISVMSRTVAALEDELGVGLLDRGARGVRLTTVGQAILIDSRHILAELGAKRWTGLWIPYFATAIAIIAASDMILTLPTRAAEALARPEALSSFVPPFHTPAFDCRLLWHARSDADLAHRWVRDRIAELR